MGGGHRFEYPKHVWSPSGGWWCRPSNWKHNTIVASLGILALTAMLFQYSTKKEHRYNMPNGFIPSQLWAKEFTSGELEKRVREQVDAS